MMGHRRPVGIAGPFQRGTPLRLIPMIGNGRGALVPSQGARSGRQLVEQSITFRREAARATFCARGHGVWGCGRHGGGWGWI